MIEKQKLNEKLANWAVVKEPVDMRVPYQHYPDIPNFTDSLDACFKWLVPKLKEQGFDVGLHDTRMRQEDEWWFEINEGNESLSFGISEEPALALCLAIEKIIDGGKNGS